MSGIIAVPSRKMDRDKILSVFDPKWRSLLMSDRARATVTELMEDKRENNDSGISVVRFRLLGQFLGFSASSGPSHVTCCVFLIKKKSIKKKTKNQ